MSFPASACLRTEDGLAGPIREGGWPEELSTEDYGFSEPVSSVLAVGP
jgi:hypothetical protein